jgi:hypothetical protein
MSVGPDADMEGCSAAHLLRKTPSRPDINSAIREAFAIYAHRKHTHKNSVVFLWNHSYDRENNVLKSQQLSTTPHHKTD